MTADSLSTQICGAQLPLAGARPEQAAGVSRFAARVQAVGSLSQASPSLQALILEDVRRLAGRLAGRLALRLDLRDEKGSASGYDRRVLCEAPGRWSLAAIVLRPGQQTQPHDHDGWGCAATVQGVERDRRFTRQASGKLALVSETDYPPGAGYLFGQSDIHQPYGADPRQVTVALHFLVLAPRP